MLGVADSFVAKFSTKLCVLMVPVECQNMLILTPSVHIIGTCYEAVG